MINKSSPTLKSPWVAYLTKPALRFLYPLADSRTAH
jgi:hypothetical protein